MRITGSANTSGSKIATHIVIKEVITVACPEARPEETPTIAHSTTRVMRSSSLIFICGSMVFEASAVAKIIRYAVEKSKMNWPRGCSAHTQNGSSGSDATAPRETTNASVACAYLT